MIEQYRSRILVVDDDPINVRLVEAQLVNEYDIMTAFSGEEALEILHHDKPDLIILDVMMPGINGYETCRRIKSSKETCFIPVIIVTALSSRNDRLEGIRAGAEDFLTKPIDRVELVTRAANLLKTKKLHDKLINSEGKFRALFENSVDAIMILSSDAAILEINNAACNMLGYDRDEMLGMPKKDLVAPEYWEKCMENTAALLEKGQDTFETLYVRKDGSRVPVEVSVKVIDYNGRPAILCNGRNISERKNAELVLKESEEKFRLLAENANDVIWTMDKDGRFLYISPSVMKLRGYTPEEVISQSLEDIFTPDSIMRISMAVASFFANLEPGVTDNHTEVFEVEQFHRDGHIVWTEAVARAVFDDEGKFLFFLGVTRDISERKKAEEAIGRYTEDLSKANQALQSLDRMKDEFISNLSHELKTPLISIKGYSELVHDEVLGPLNEKQKNAMQIVLDKYEHLSFLLDSLIYMSIAKSGNVSYRFDPVRIEDILKRIAEYFYFKAGEKQISIITSFESDIPLLKGDVEYLPYLFRSLIDNAIKFSPVGGMVEVSAFRDNAHVHVVVKDSGIGIPKSEITNVFQRFYQIDGSTVRKYGGSGLGLYVSKTIAHVHDGEIWIESEEGSGTAVHVRFPVYSPFSTCI